MPLLAKTPWGPAPIPAGRKAEAEATLKPEERERATWRDYKGDAFGAYLEIWTTRENMALAIRREARTGVSRYRPLEPLGPAEGY